MVAALATFPPSNCRTSLGSTGTMTPKASMSSITVTKMKAKAARVGALTVPVATAESEDMAGGGYTWPPQGCHAGPAQEEKASQVATRRGGSRRRELTAESAEPAEVLGIWHADCFPERMLARAVSGTLIGVDAREVIVECHRAKGLPGLCLVGLARGAVRESTVRVRSALIACGAPANTHRLVVNMLPAELEKEASALDLALAVTLLVTSELLPASALEGRVFYGELSLGGALEPVRGAVLLADLARRRGDLELIVPADNAAEAAAIPGVRAVGARHLDEVVQHLRGERVLPAASPGARRVLQPAGCLSEVRGQTRAKRALEIAAAGGHNLLLVGPPGSGKTMLARRLPGLLPELSPDESIEVTRVHSAAGVLPGGAHSRAI
jgi:hypothetical protein